MKPIHWSFPLIGSLAFALSTHLARSADTIFLKNGSELEGTVTQDDAQSVAIKLRSGVTRSFKRNEVESVIIDPDKPAVVPAPEEKPPSKPASTPTPNSGGPPGKKEPAEKRRPEGTAPKAQGPEAADGIAVGTVAPEIEGKVWFTKDGKAPEMKGKIYLVDFWFKG